MTIELTRKKSVVSYKTHKMKPCEVWYRMNQKNARWQWMKTYATPEQATAALLALRSNERDEE